MLTEEQQRLHRLPEQPYTTVLGETRKVPWTSTISFGGVTYRSHTSRRRVGVGPRDGDEIVVRHCAPSGVTEVARHRRGTPHAGDRRRPLPARPDGPLARKPKPTSAAETEFLAIGEGARSWLVEAAAAGIRPLSRCRVEPERESNS